MSLFVDDKKFTEDLHKQLFDKDMAPESAVSLQTDNNWVKEIEAYIEQINRYRNVKGFS